MEGSWSRPCSALQISTDDSPSTKAPPRHGTDADFNQSFHIKGCYCRKHRRTGHIFVDYNHGPAPNSRARHVPSNGPRHCRTFPNHGNRLGHFQGVIRLESSYPLDKHVPRATAQNFDRTGRDVRSPGLRNSTEGYQKTTRSEDSRTTRDDLPSKTKKRTIGAKKKRIQISPAFLESELRLVVQRHHLPTDRLMEVFLDMAPTANAG